MKSFLKMFSVASLLGAALVFSGCGGGGSDSPYYGGVIVDPGTVVPGVTPGTAAVTVPAAGGSITDGGAAVKTTYTFPAGAFNYAIAGFGAGDKLVLPAGSTTPTVKNSSYTDGSVIIESSLNNQTIAVTLTGLSASDDSKLNSIADFTTVFGADTIK